MKKLLDPNTLNAGGGSAMQVPTPVNLPPTLLSPAPPVAVAPAKPAPGAASKVIHTIEGDFQHVEAIVKSVFVNPSAPAPTLLTAAPLAPVVAPASNKSKAVIGFIILAVGVLGLSYIIHLL